MATVELLLPKDGDLLQDLLKELHMKTEHIILTLGLVLVVVLVALGLFNKPRPCTVIDNVEFTGLNGTVSHGGLKCHVESETVDFHFSNFTSYDR